jgi:hypothetical protein
VAEAYGDGTARLTPEENILFVNIPDDKLPAMLADPLFTKFKVNPGRGRYHQRLNTTAYSSAVQQLPGPQLFSNVQKGVPITVMAYQDTGVVCFAVASTKGWGFNSIQLHGLLLSEICNLHNEHGCSLRTRVYNPCSQPPNPRE